MMAWSPGELSPGPLIFTDLDGTLLDHHSYSFQPALPALKRLAQLAIPVIPVTSKTCSELIQLRDELDNPHPFIVENGAAIYIPKGYFSNEVIMQFSEISVCQLHPQFLVYTLGKPRQHWLQLLSSLDNSLQTCFDSFDELGDLGIVQHTGLPEERAKRSNQREASEPLLWRGSNEQLNQLRETVEQNGGQVLKGGRFIHILDKRAGKGRAMQWLHQLYSAAFPETTYTRVALGDAENDLSMLEAADHPMLVKNDDRPAPDTRHIKTVVSSSEPGPAGWNELVATLLRDL